jgi:hypothetical protein
MTMRMLTKLTLPLAALAGLQPVATQAQSAANAQLKTAIIFNIIRFVDFGEGGSTLSLCAARGVAGAQDLATLNGQRIRNRTIVHRSVDPASTGGCDVVYLGAPAWHAADWGFSFLHQFRRHCRAGAYRKSDPL